MANKIKNIALVISLTTLAFFNGCSINNASKPLNKIVSSDDFLMTLSASKFDQKLAQHILNHPNINNDIHCETIPLVDGISNRKQLCTLIIDEYEPFYVTKVTFFIKDEKGDINVLNNLEDSGSSSFSHFKFSDNGKYLYVSFADEGHPFFVFFDTQKFIHNDKEPEVGEVFEEYYLDHIESFYDNGDFVFSLREGTIFACLDGEIEIEPKTETTDEVKRCLFHYNIFDQYNSFGSSKPFVPSRSKRKITMPYVCKAFN
jgi:hypothetical protein